MFIWAATVRSCADKVWPTGAKNPKQWLRRPSGNTNTAKPRLMGVWRERKLNVNVSPVDDCVTGGVNDGRKAAVAHRP